MTTTETTPVEPPKPPRKAVKTAEAAPDPIDLHRLIRCLEEVEAPGWNYMGGKLQITRALWHDYGQPFNYRQANDPSVARQVAARALIHYISDLKQMSVDPTVQVLAKCWRHGWNGAMDKLNAKSDYAERVANLYGDKTWEPAND